MNAVPQFLTGLDRWILWRESTRAGLPTKIPVSARGGVASDVTDPNNWGTYGFCTAARVRTKGAWDGEGIVLGDLGTGEALVGLDLDSCLVNSQVAGWAQPYLDALDTYAEVSPSGSGLKLFFRVPHADLPAIRAAFAIPSDMNGRKKTYGNGAAHGPAAEIYLSHRFFTVTGNQWPEGGDHVALIGLDALRTVAALFGPRAELTAGSDDLGDTTTPPPEALRTRLATAMRDRAHLAERWLGDTAGLADTSRSGFDMSLGAMLKAAGFTYGEMRAALLSNPHGAGHEHTTDDRYFERIWSRSAVPARPPEPEPPPSITDPGYYAADEAMSAGEWLDIEARETGVAVPASPEARKQAGDDVVWTISEPWQEQDIPVRPWIARGYLMRRSITVVSGPGSAGKSSLMVAWASAFAIGSSFHRMKVTERLRVATYNVEDDADEQRRRFSATLRKMGLTPEDVRDHLLILGPARVGTLLHTARDGTLLVNTPVLDRIEDHIKAFRPDVLMLDPFVELHQAEENDNTAIRAVMARFRGMAIQYDMAIVILHHARKGGANAAPGDPDSLRGASSIVGAARVALTLNVMTEDEAKSFGLAPEKRHDYFRLDRAKSNYAPIVDAEWFERHEITLDNGTTEQAADGVAVVWPWRPTSTLAQQEPSGINRVLDVLAQGHEPGILFTATRQGGGQRWAGKILMSILDVNEKQAALVLAEWLASGLLTEVNYQHPTWRRQTSGVKVNDSRRPTDSA